MVSVRPTSQRLLDQIPLKKTSFLKTRLTALMFLSLKCLKLRFYLIKIRNKKPLNF